MYQDSGSGRADELIDVAIRLVEEKGVRGLTLRALGKKAKLSRGAPYHHFPGGKKELLAAIAERGFRRLKAALDAAVGEATGAPAAADPAERVLVLAEAYMRFAVENPGLYRLMFDGELADRSGHPDLGRIIAEIFDELREALREAVDPAGRDERALTELTLGVAGLLHGLAMQAIDEWIRHQGDTARATEWTRRVLATLLGPHLGDAGTPRATRAPGASPGDVA